MQVTNAPKSKDPSMGQLATSVTVSMDGKTLAGFVSAHAAGDAKSYSDDANGAGIQPDRFAVA